MVTLKLERERKLLTQQELSDVSGVSLPTIKRLESGKSKAALRTIRKLAKALGIEPMLLFYLREAP